MDRMQGSWIYRAHGVHHTYVSPTPVSYPDCLQKVHPHANPRQTLLSPDSRQTAILSAWVRDQWCSPTGALPAHDLRNLNLDSSRWPCSWTDALGLSSEWWNQSEVHAISRLDHKNLPCILHSLFVFCDDFGFWKLQQRLMERVRDPWVNGWNRITPSIPQTLIRL